MGEALVRDPEKARQKRRGLGAELQRTRTVPEIRLTYKDVRMITDQSYVVSNEDCGEKIYRGR